MSCVVPGCKSHASEPNDENGKKSFHRLANIPHLTASPHSIPYYPAPSRKHTTPFSKHLAPNRKCHASVPPTVIVPNQLLGAPLGTDVVLECTIEAHPNTINYWLKNRGEMLLDGPKYAITEERASYRVQMTLVIRSFARSDIGTYNCVSTNSLGKSEGTLRLYEIKLYPSSQSSAESNLIGPTDEAVKLKTALSVANLVISRLSTIVLLCFIVVML
ncbi:immunoglobulin i-set domain-containing protein [Phthorimaea operculella]|nr:immunoglobulin i-set domain-containing protein [Phthorimaea operculella]